MHCDERDLAGFANRDNGLQNADTQGKITIVRKTDIIFIAFGLELSLVVAVGSCREVLWLLCDVGCGLWMVHRCLSPRLFASALWREVSRLHMKTWHDEV